MVAIAAISLLVGGIGIMNIVLATVLERTREIGIRRSIGARRFDIVRQFLTESVLISIGGGLLGIGFGFLPGLADCPHRRMEDYCDHLQCRHRLWRILRRGRHFRDLPRRKSLPHQPHRRATIRVTSD